MPDEPRPNGYKSLAAATTETLADFLVTKEGIVIIVRPPKARKR